MSQRSDRVKELFESGYNCSQSVVLAFKDELNLDEKTLAMMASCFGGGMGRLREVCGTVSGMFMVYGLMNGYYIPKDNVHKTENYKAVQELAAEFKRRNGSIICRELLGLDKPEGTYIPSERTEEYYKKRPCGQLAKIAVEVLEEYLEKNPV